MAAAYKKSLLAVGVVVVGTGGVVVVAAGVVVGVAITEAPAVVVATGVVVIFSPQDAAKADNTIRVNITKSVLFIFVSITGLISLDHIIVSDIAAPDN